MLLRVYVGVRNHRHMRSVCVSTAQRVAAHQFHLAQRGNWPSIDGRGSLFTLQGPRLFV